MPNHFPKTIKKSFKEIIFASLNGKDAKNSSDYRESLLIVCAWLMKIQPDHFVTKILLTHAEIQEILYKTDEYKSTTSILCLHSLYFRHAMLLKINLQGKTNDTDKSNNTAYFQEERRTLRKKKLRLNQLKCLLISRLTTTLRMSL